MVGYFDFTRGHSIDSSSVDLGRINSPARVASPSRLSMAIFQPADLLHHSSGMRRDRVCLSNYDEDVVVGLSHLHRQECHGAVHLFEHFLSELDGFIERQPKISGCGSRETFPLSPSLPAFEFDVPPFDATQLLDESDCILHCSPRNAVQREQMVLSEKRTSGDSCLCYCPQS